MNKVQHRQQHGAQQPGAAPPDFSVIIPARYAARRLPGKPLLDIGGKPMVQHTFERASESHARQVVVATDDQRIAEAVRSFGGRVIFTADTHCCGTERLQQAASLLGLAEQEVVVNVQADEPLLPAAAIDQVATNLQTHPRAGIASLCERIPDQPQRDDPSAVKVVMDHTGFALYFSRSPIPYQSGAAGHHGYRHIGLYAYRVSVLNQFVRWPPAPLELAEQLEQLRALSHGVRIHVAVSEQGIPPGVDTAKDLEVVRARLQTCSL